MGKTRKSFSLPSNRILVFSFLARYRRIVGYALYSSSVVTCSRYSNEISFPKTVRVCIFSYLADGLFEKIIRNRIVKTGNVEGARRLQLSRYWHVCRRSSRQVCVYPLIKNISGLLSCGRGYIYIFIYHRNRRNGKRLSRTQSWRYTTTKEHPYLDGTA